MQGLAHPKALSDRELLAALPRLVQGDNERSAELLAHLAEVDARQLYAGLGFPSLFAFCVQSLGFCESSAGRRIAAARVCSRFPAAFAHVASGNLHLSALSALSKHLTPGNAEELFSLCARQSIRRIEELLAARFPQPSIPDAVRRLPSRAPGAGSDQHATPAAGAPAAHDAGRAPPFEPAHPERPFVPLAADRFAVRFTADSEFRALLEEVSALASHRNPKGHLLSLMKAALRSYKLELLKQRFGIGKKSHKSGPRQVALKNQPVGSPSNANQASISTPLASELASTPRRHRTKIAPATARAVYLRDEGQCTFVSPSGQRCRARRFLQLDHIVPHVLSLDDRAQNLRLRCHAHNQHHARTYFGARYLRAVVARARQRKRVEEAA